MHALIKKLLTPFSSKKLLLIVLFLVLVTHIDIAHATENKETIEESAAHLLNLGISFLNSLLWPFLLIIGDLMDTDLIVGPGMEEHLLAIWLQVRNLVNVAFVLVLLFVAFYNVAGFGGEGDLAIKTILPKIVLGLVLVNFSYVGGKVALDLVNVGTTAAFSLPMMAVDEDGEDFAKVRDTFEQKVCYKSYDAEKNIPTYWSKPSSEQKDNKVPIYTQLFCELDEKEGSPTKGQYTGLTQQLAERWFSEANSSNIGLVMAVNMGALGDYALLKEEGIVDFTDLVVSELFALLMFLIFAISYIVLAIVLIVRIVVIWMALALLPLAVLVYVVPQIKEWFGGGGEVAKKVIKNLIAPIPIGLSMSMGYILISAWNGLAQFDANSAFKIGDVLSTEVLISGVDELPQFIIVIASAVIVWVGVFAAANDTYASFATEAIKGLGEKVRDAAFKLPLLAPTIPVGLKEEGQQPMLSPAAFVQGINEGVDLIRHDTLAYNQWKDFKEGHPALKDLLDSESPRRSPQDSAKALKDLTKDKREITPEEFRQVAQIIMDNVKYNAPASKEKDDFLKKLEGAQRRGNLQELKKIVEDVKDPEKLGFRKDEWEEFKTKHLKGVRDVRAQRETKKKASPASETQADADGDGSSTSGGSATDGTTTTASGAGHGAGGGGTTTGSGATSGTTGGTTGTTGGGSTTGGASTTGSTAGGTTGGGGTTGSSGTGGSGSGGGGTGGSGAGGAGAGGAGAGGSGASGSGGAGGAGAAGSGHGP